MSYDYDDEGDGASRVLWSRIAVFLTAGLLLFLLGRACAPDGVDPDEFRRVSAEASELQIQRDEALQRLAQAGSATSGSDGGGASEPTSDDDPTEEDTADASGDATEEETDDGGGGDSGDTYTVEAGDTLNGIAAEFGVDADELAELNDIDDPSDLVVGQELEIPS